jgi:hypothetical protein
MEFVDKIRKGDPEMNGAVSNPDRIVHMRLAAEPESSAPQATSADAVPRTMPSAGMATKFDAAQLICGRYTAGAGAADSSGMLATLGRVWIEGYLAGYAKARNQLEFSADASQQQKLARQIRDVCEQFPKASIQTVASQSLNKDIQPLPGAVLDNFAPTSFTCSDYIDVHANDRARADIADVWVFAFIEGFKNVAQPQLSIQMENKPLLTGAVAKTCGSYRDMSLVNLTALVADKVKLDAGRHK